MATQDVSSEDVCVIPRTRDSKMFVLRSGRPKGVKEADNKIEQYHNSLKIQNTTKQPIPNRKKEIFQSAYFTNFSFASAPTNDEKRVRKFVYLFYP